MATVSFKGATRIYPGSAIPAVERLDLDIQDGEFMVLVGPSGSGNSTALLMLAGLEEVNEGSIYIGDRPAVLGHPDALLYPTAAAVDLNVQVNAKGETRAMSFEKTPSGTRGSRAPSRSNAFTRFIGRMMIKSHRRNGDRFMGMDVLYLTTVGAKTGQKRQTPLARFPDGDGSWLVVASLGGSARNPSWYHNIAAHPDQVWIEVAGHQLRVTAEQLDGEPREVAWQRIIESQPRYAGYQTKTDRVLPILRLSPAQNP